METLIYNVLFNSPYDSLVKKPNLLSSGRHINKDIEKSQIKRFHIGKNNYVKRTYVIPYMAFIYTHTEEILAYQV